MLDKKCLVNRKEYPLRFGLTKNPPEKRKSPYQSVKLIRRFEDY